MAQLVWPRDAAAKTYAQVKQIMTDTGDEKTIGKISKDELKNGLFIDGIELDPVKGGATQEQATVLAAGPAGQKRKAEASPGWYSVNGVPVQAVTGKRWIWGWSGSAWLLYDMGDLPQDVYTNSAAVDFSIEDENNRAIAQFYEGHVRTKSFDSKNAAAKSDVNVYNKAATSNADLSIEDEAGKALAQFSDGHFKTKNFDSRSLQIANALDVDFSIEDEQTKAILQIINGHIKTKNFDSSKISSLTGGKSLKLLFWGNSFSRDSGMYLGKLLEEMGVTDVTIGIIYFGGAYLEWHYNNLTTSNYQFDIYTTSAGVWSSSSGRNANYCLTYADWDMIVLQERSIRSHDYTYYQPYLNYLIDHIFSVVKHPVSLAFNMIPASPGAGSWGSDLSSNDFFLAQLACYERIKNETAIEYFLYSGAAIQNARQTSLSSVGNNLVSSDGTHLNEGLPCLIAAYGNAVSLIDYIGLKKSVFGSQIRPTQQWIESINVIERNGTSIGVDEANVLIAQKCALMAYKFPFKISQVNF